MPQKKVMVANHFTLKELSGALHTDRERAKAEMLKADPVCGRSVIICQDMQRMFALCCYMMRRQALYSTNHSFTFFFFISLCIYNQL